MQITKTSPSEFIKSLPEEQQSAIAELDKKITAAMPGVERVMWEGNFWGGSAQKIIGYGAQSYKRSDGKNVDWFTVGLAQQKNYITVFINGVEDGKYLVDKYKAELGKVKAGKSSVSFTDLDNVNLPKLLELVAKASKLATN